MIPAIVILIQEHQLQILNLPSNKYFPKESLAMTSINMISAVIAITVLGFLFCWLVSQQSLKLTWDLQNSNRPAHSKIKQVITTGRGN